ncbi:DNA adenine methylase [Mycobacterium sp. NPDC050041]|uniref:DNA adenine methylase n=1 Tax=Mycobacterium sp. NPDC050041 TaxID=3364293 RepID=UPI003C2FEFD1
MATDADRCYHRNNEATRIPALHNAFEPMRRYISPLRYPGGKARIAPFAAQLLAVQRPRARRYAEPFAGGAGSALTLLVGEHVDLIHINDLDPGIAAFWRCVFNQTKRFVRLVEDAELSIDAWHSAREIYLSPKRHSDLDLGFATFFLNRCNRSGILSARPIGGLEQTGQWGIDARFNRSELAERISFVGSFRRRVQLTELDARDFLDLLTPHRRELVAYVDPPYLGQGDKLYLDKLSEADHRDLAEKLRRSPLNWFLTYDSDDRVTDELYVNLRCAEFDIKHTAQVNHVGTEFVVFADNLFVPDDLQVLATARGRWVVA